MLIIFFFHDSAVRQCNERLSASGLTQNELYTDLRCFFCSLYFKLSAVCCPFAFGWKLPGPTLTEYLKLYAKEFIYLFSSHHSLASVYRSASLASTQSYLSFSFFESSVSAKRCWMPCLISLLGSYTCNSDRNWAVLLALHLATCSLSNLLCRILCVNVW